MMDARFPVTTSAHGWARRQPARWLNHDTLVTLCWLLAVAGLAGSYWLPPLALQAASCLAGLAAAAAALLMMVIGHSR
jgi:hypothetical protein